MRPIFLQKMVNKIQSNINGKSYYAHEAVRILDPYQAALYWCNGVNLIDIYPSRDYKTNKALIVFVFKKKETKDVFDLWCKKELK